jgi:hypothetical protein
MSPWYDRVMARTSGALATAMTNMTLLELLSEVGGADLSLRREDFCVAVALIALPEGRQVLTIERTYRPGICAILDPTQEEVEVARNGDLWQLWNSERGALLLAAV